MCEGDTGRGTQAVVSGVHALYRCEGLEALVACWKRALKVVFFRDGNLHEGGKRWNVVQVQHD